MKSVNIQLDHNNSIEITQIDDTLFEVRLSMDGSISMYYMTRAQLENLEQLGVDSRIEMIRAGLLHE
ncbi:hypothetical protein [Lysinibacillus parviboronicapiens]|uniref:KTSC domain-containing protein n=1 Tax=Lysinibacillus parviboronicapiens TaxID=436516 RepID=A0ABV2PR25_9BACI|nr:hypothetical protein [Lysinibacillus parviboronicapiens]